MLLSGDFRHIQYVNTSPGVHREQCEEEKASSRRYNQGMLKTISTTLVWRRQACHSCPLSLKLPFLPSPQIPNSHGLHSRSHQISEILRWTSVKIPVSQILLSSPRRLVQTDNGMPAMSTRLQPWTCLNRVKGRGKKWTVVFKPPPLLNPKRSSWWWNRDQSLIFSESILPFGGNFPDALREDFWNMKIQKQIMEGILRIKTDFTRGKDFSLWNFLCSLLNCTPLCAKLRSYFQGRTFGSRLWWQEMCWGGGGGEAEGLRLELM